MGRGDRSIHTSAYNVLKMPYRLEISEVTMKSSNIQCILITPRT
jgi:hypothetical protein